MAHQKIQSIAGLKVIAIWLIFWWHSWLTNPPCDLGARCCEFFFVASGFLVFISHHNVSKPCTWKASADYVRKKLVSVWPIHFLAFCLCLCSMPLADIFTKDSLIKGLIHLLLLQSWSNSAATMFSFNGPSWFLSSLLFCYFSAPVLLRMIRRKRKILVLFPAVFLIRYAVEEIHFYYPNEYWVLSLHWSPVLRMMEFFLGMMVGSVWSDACCRVNRRCKNRAPVFSFWLFSIAEAAALYFTGMFLVTKQNFWGRAIFVLWFCAFIFIFAFDKGCLSRLLSLKPMGWFASVQFEFFIFHIPIINLVTRYLEPYIPSGKKLAAIAFATTLFLSQMYRLFLKNTVEKQMQSLLSKGWNWMIS